MKKIYLLTLALTALMVGAVAQPTCPTAIAIRYTFGSPVSHCVLHVAGLPAQTGWSITLVRPFNEGGTFIPVFGSNPADFDVDVNPANGQADFIYNCNGVNVDYVLVKHFDGTTITSCQINVIADGGSLPVKLTSFTGRLQNDNAVTLDWSSSMEFESSKYEVERSSDGKYFEKVGTLNGAGTINTTSKYTFNDKLPGTGGYFYRLKQIDFDGVFEYSKVVYVNSKKGAGVVSQIFPNPFKGEIQLIGATSSDLTPNNIRVFSINGQRVQYKVMGANSIMIDPSAPDGIYILKVKEQTFKLVKSQSSGTSY